jgi:ferrochelatase
VSVGVLLMTYGTSETSEGVEDYLRSVYKREPPVESVTEFRRRFDIIGRSPLIDITRAQGAGLQAALDARDGAGAYLVEVGMLHTAPRIADALARLIDAGAERVVCIVLAPQYSALIMGGYAVAVSEAVAQQEIAIPVEIAGPWHDVPGWIDSLAERVTETIAAAGDLPVVFTAHSLPEVVVKRDPRYLEQLHETIHRVAERVGLREGQWQFGYQSAGHSPEEWLTPDFKDLVPEIAAAGHSGVIFVPVQFLADHLEILYDIDVAGREEAAEVGLAFHRIPMPNTSPTFIDALRQVVDREVAAVR